MAGSSVLYKVQLNVLAHPNPMHLFANVTASGQVTSIHFLLQMSSRMGQPTMQWDG